MPDTEQELFSQTYGPFAESVYAIFDRAGEGFCLSFEQGPAYDYERLNSAGTIVYKFPAGTTFELRVTRTEDRHLKFHGSHLSTLGQAEAVALAPAAGPVPVCGSEFCSEVIPCPDPTKRVMICTGGVPRCVNSL